MEENVQLRQSTRKWNEEDDLQRWENHYFEDNYNGNRLRAREKKVLEFLDSLNLKRNANILELGYGAGITSAKIYNRGFNITGVDISAKLRELAINNCEKVKSKKNKATFSFNMGNAEKIDFPENTFDCVVGLGFMQYLSDPIQCIKEIKRVLKPNGYCILAQRNMYGISSMDGPLKWGRSWYYLIARPRYELRWQDTPLVEVILHLTKILSPCSEKIKSFEKSLIQHKRIGLVRKNAFSLLRFRLLIERGGLRIIKINGAGYLARKEKFLPRFARRADAFLQQKEDSSTSKVMTRFGNSIIVLAQKIEE